MCIGGIPLMDLEIPPEPLKDKEVIKRGLQAHRDLEIANLKQGTWIASPLWSKVGWGKELKKYGFTWQKFIGVVRDHYPISMIGLREMRDGRM